jgi:hypothetical protein
MALLPTTIVVSVKDAPAVRAALAVFLDLLQQVDAFIEKQGEADFYTGPARAMRDLLAGKEPADYLQRGLDKFLAERGLDGVPPAHELLEGRNSQHVLKAEGESSDATDRETCVNASPDGGPMGVGQAAAAAPAGGMHGVTDDDGNLLLGQRADGSPIWNDPEAPLPLRRVAHFTEDEARCKAWELAAAGYGATGISELHHA